MVHPTLPMSPYESGVFLGFSASSTPLSTHRAPKTNMVMVKMGSLKLHNRTLLTKGSYHVGCRHLLYTVYELNIIGYKKNPSS